MYIDVIVVKGIPRINLNWCKRQLIIYTVGCLSN